MSTKPKPFVFVLMPFSQAFYDAYELAISPACEAAGAYAERVDKQIFSGSIIERVYNQIAKADLIVADMSERNPNVFYEVGYAHALGKTTVLLTKDADDIPFDLRQYPHVVYGTSLATLKTEVERRVRWHCSNPKGHETTSPELLVRVNGVDLPSDGDIVVAPRGEMKYFRLDFAIQNRSDRNPRTITFRAGVSAPTRIEKCTDRREYEYESVALDDGRMFMSPGHFSLLPREWVGIDFLLQKRHDRVSFSEAFDCTVHLYFDSGTLAFAFRVRVKDQDHEPLSATDA